MTTLRLAGPGAEAMAGLRPARLAAPLRHQRLAGGLLCAMGNRVGQRNRKGRMAGRDWVSAEREDCCGDRGDVRNAAHERHPSVERGMLEDHTGLETLLAGQHHSVAFSHEHCFFSHVWTISRRSKGQMAVKPTLSDAGARRENPGWGGSLSSQAVFCGVESSVSAIRTGQFGTFPHRRLGSRI
jgi:hypothetical protein